MFHIVTDGTADFPPGWVEKYRIHVVPFRIHFGNDTFVQDVDLDDEGFYRLIAERKMIPKTSQATPQQMEALYTRIAQPGDTVLSIHVSSKLSGTYESAVLAARRLAGKIRVVPFDSLAGAAALAFMCREARLLAERQAGVEAILARLRAIREAVRVVLMVDNLEYPRMSGRVKAMQAFVASALRIKPIITLEEGLLVAQGRVRTRARALAYVVQRVKEEMQGRPAHVAVVHARAPQDAARLAEMAQQALDLRELIRTSLSIAVTVHLGPGTVGLVAYPAEENHALVA